ncbi:phytanoyl-CoA dioxygenase family protein [Phenylobacterium sp.]|uniref:phytanoyl-CoA dioxygenase family protein n=1 Tax=Phenylobacterium sp. TaxID=1871053 RepID=UPI0035619CD9
MTKVREVLTPALLDEYRREGAVRLVGAVPARDAEAMAATLRRKIEARPKRAARPAQLSSRTGEFAAMASPSVRAVLNEILGDWEEPAHWGLPLVSFHTGEAAWDVPHEHWHVDLGARPQDPRLARLFAVLAPSRPGGGGTGYIAGSHVLIRALADAAGRALPSAQARKALAARSPWFAALTSPPTGEDRVRCFMREGSELDGTAVRVCEMLGDPGDVILMHPLLMHAPTPNVLATPRMMLAQFVYGRA